ncbi:MAG: deoxyribonuclease IV [Candidatus Hodarchaeota archaeon]
MGWLGAHVSISGGVDKAPSRGKEIGCESIQIFTKNQRQWYEKPLTQDEVLAFKSEMISNGLREAVVHDAYLINLASPNAELFRKSVESFHGEVIRAEALGIQYLVFHPGAHMGSGEEAGINRIAEALNEVLARTKESELEVLLETTAGQGTSLGYRFEQLADIIDLVEPKDRIAVCFDTSHAFGAGYDLREEDAYNTTMDEFDGILGLDRLKVIHLNDTRQTLGSRRDLHENIGEGEIGLEGFRLLVNDRRFQNVSMILETPGTEMSDRKNLRILRSLIES